MSAALWVVLSAIDRQSQRVLDQNGDAWPFSTIIGPTSPIDGRESIGWRVIIAPDSYDQLSQWRLSRLLSVHIGVDLLFILALLTVTIIITLMLWDGWARSVIVGLVTLGSIADVTEDLLMLARTPAINILVGATAIKWLAVAVFVLLMIVTVVVRQRLGIKAVWKALTVHRLSFVPTIALFVLSVLAGAAILEQLPDAQRRWLDEPHGHNLAQAVAAGLAVALLAGSTYLTTRVRNAWVNQRGMSNPQPPLRARLRWWFVGPVIVAVCLVTAAVAGSAPIAWPGDDVLGGIEVVRSLIFVFAPILVVVIVSRIIRWRVSAGALQLSGQMPTFNPYEQRAIRLAGHGAVAAIFVVVGIGLIRAFVPILLVSSDQVPLDSGGATVFLGLGVLITLTPWVLLIVARPSGLPQWAAGGTGVRAGLATLVGWLIVFLALGAMPVWADSIGLAATAILAISALTGMVAGLGMIIQDRMPAEVFRVFGLQRTPLISTLVLTLLLVNAFSGVGTIHYVDFGTAIAGSGPRSDPRPDFSKAFGDWIKASTAACRTEAGANPRVRPVVMVAAEGGGIRAAYWTVRGLEEMGRRSPCAAASTLFSGGASGGSVGLTVARYSRPSADGKESAARKAVRAVEQMAEPGPLSQATDGFMIRDVFYGATGVPLPVYDDSSRRFVWSWADRARLLEQGWKLPLPDQTAGAAWGTRSFLDEAGRSPGPGALILNTSSAKNVCRSWLSEIRIPGQVAQSVPSSNDPERSCDSSPGPGPRTIDVFSSYGPYGSSGGDAAWNRCLGDISAATAALLTARFPYVTPGGVAGPCPRRDAVKGPTEPYWPRTQFVDGGYLENTGLATVTDLAPIWLAAIRDHNSSASGDSSQSILVPVVVYLSNGDQKISQPRIDQGLTSEVTLPISTLIKGGSSLSGADALLPRARSLTAVDQFCPEERGTVLSDCAAAAASLPARVIVVDRTTQPEIAPPLGWTFSSSSRISLDRAMDAQVRSHCIPAGATESGSGDDQNPNCKLGYGALGDFLGYFS